MSEVIQRPNGFKPSPNLGRVKKLAEAAAVLVGIGTAGTILCLLLGRSFLRGYLGVYGVSWCVNDLSKTTWVSFGAQPTVMVALCGMIAALLLKLPFLHLQTSLEEDRRLRERLKWTSYGAFATLFVFLPIVINYLIPFSPSLLDGLGIVMTAVAIFIVPFWLYELRLKVPVHVAVISTIVFIGTFYLSPLLQGYAAGLRETGATSPRLVQAIDPTTGTTTTLQLLLKDSGFIYACRPVQQTTTGTVGQPSTYALRILKAEEAKLIQVHRAAPVPALWDFLR